jgi:NitT/TauT family transport system permease protein
VSSAVVIAAPERQLARVVGKRAVDWLPALIVFAAGIAAWQGIVVGFHIQKFLLPKPSAIAVALWNQGPELWRAGWYTFKEALGGFFIGSALAIFMALVLARWRRTGEALLPYMIAANAVPIIAFAPITNAWFGLLNPHSKWAIVSVLCFFPVLVNTLRGLTSVHPSAIELMRSYAAGELEIFRRVRIPNSLPFMFAGLKVACVLSMIGAIVGDYFGGSIQALGVLIENSVSLFQFETGWAAIVVASVLGIAFYAAVSAAERATTRWQPSARGATD